MKKKQIMLIEDEELILEGIRNIIDWESLGMEVLLTASNGTEALALLEGRSADIIVTDISMPVMDGLTFLSELRKRDERVRCIILTGYEEFDYARKAIRLDVEEYILKPIDEEKLEKVLVTSAQKLDEMDKKKMDSMDDKAGWIQFLKGKLSEENHKKYISVLPEMDENSILFTGIMKINMETLKVQMSELLLEMQKDDREFRVIYLSSDTLLLLYYTGQPMEPEGFFEGIQDSLEGGLGIQTFISIADSIRSYEELGAAYEQARRLMKYQLVEGYGSSISHRKIQNRKSEDIEIDESWLRRLILKKDREASVNYVEDLFINNVRENIPVDDIYQLSLKIAMFLQEIKKEYQLLNRDNMHNLTELVEAIYHAESVASLKTIFINEIAEITDSLNENDSQFTPVVKQIISEVQQDYKEDMNLKTLSYKYHMNASYLGQIFQKEVGCSFAQYLSNIKNGRAKELLLNTNMKINDIAREVGYMDTSYFYRKFKQCYGISPATLREMKKY